MRPSLILKIYYICTCLAGLIFTIPLAHAVQTHELGARGAMIMTLCWNVLFTMILPLVMDWGETRYFKARFMQIEEVAQTNPELAAFITEQCKKLSIPGFRFAIIDDSSDEMFSYGLWRSNPRMVLPKDFLTVEQRSRTIPSIEAELARFASQDHTFVFLFFTGIQIMVQHLLIAFT